MIVGTTLDNNQEAEESSRRDLEDIVSNLQKEISKRDGMIASLQLSSVNSSVISRQENTKEYSIWKILIEIEKDNFKHSAMVKRLIKE